MDAKQLKTFDSLHSENHSVLLLLNEVSPQSTNSYVHRVLWRPKTPTKPSSQTEVNSGTGKPNNCLGEDSRVTSRKRKGGIDHPEPNIKRQRGASESLEVTVETVPAKGTKRKANTSTDIPTKKQRGGNGDTNTDEPTKASVEESTWTDNHYEALAEQLPATETQKTRGDISCEVSPSSSSPSTSQQNVRSVIDLDTTSRATFEAAYLQLHMLGEGGFGSVYAGIRRSDDLPVAIKHIPKVDVEYELLVLDGVIHLIPLEVYLMLRAAGGPESLGRSAAVTLLDWFDLEHELLLVMERPVPSMDLISFIENKGPLSEDQAKDIMKQLVEGAIQMHSLKVFHRDIKTENVLVETGSDVPRVRIIDFGCGCFINNEPLRIFSGTSAFVPPEFKAHGEYEAEPTTVWQLGALLYEIVDGHKQFSTSKFLRNKIKFSHKLSKDCHDFLNGCLALNPKERATLEQMRLHPWLH